MDDVRRFGARSADEEVVRLDVSVDKVLFMYRLHSRELCNLLASYKWWETTLLRIYHLLCHHNDCLRRESPVAMVEQVFQGRSKEVNDKDIV